MKKLMVAGNWKMNHGPKMAEEFMLGLKDKKLSSISADFLIFPPSISWQQVATGCKGVSNLSWGLQNTFPADSGAFTGELSTAMCGELGATHVLVGHSERRQIFGEPDDFLAEKVIAAQNKKVVPVLCVGETLEQRDAGQTNEVICSQLELGLKQANLREPFLVAYEPVWAIGTGKVATPERAGEAHQVLREKLTELMGNKALASDVIFLYGGSVKPENAKELFTMKDVDGFLVGGASLKPDSFADIAINALEKNGESE